MNEAQPIVEIIHEDEEDGTKYLSLCRISLLFFVNNLKQK